MTKFELREAALRLPLEDRLDLAEQLWDSIEQEAHQLPLHDWQKELLDQRLDDAEKDPDGWLNWDEAKRRILGIR